MKHLHDFGDQRALAWCVYCGGSTETRDHVPSKVFLDEPYPENLPVVRACGACNRSASADEQYVACLLECVLAGSARAADVRREKIRRTLENRSALAAKLTEARHEKSGKTVFDVEIQRVQRVVTKLARGLSAYELHVPQYEHEPASISIFPFPLLSTATRESFEVPEDSGLAPWPEVGSRAMQRIMTEEDVDADGWVVVQSGRYRYRASVGEGVVVRMVLSEYLACEVVWDY